MEQPMDWRECLWEDERVHLKPLTAEQLKLFSTINTVQDMSQILAGFNAAGTIARNWCYYKGSQTLMYRRPTGVNNNMVNRMIARKLRVAFLETGDGAHGGFPGGGYLFHFQDHNQAWIEVDCRQYMATRNVIEANSVYMDVYKSNMWKTETKMDKMILNTNDQITTAMFWSVFFAEKAKMAVVQKSYYKASYGGYQSGGYNNERGGFRRGGRGGRGARGVFRGRRAFGRYPR